jgi:hypothetical protein
MNNLMESLSVSFHLDSKALWISSMTSKAPEHLCDMVYKLSAQFIIPRVDFMSVLDMLCTPQAGQTCAYMN